MSATPEIRKVKLNNETFIPIIGTGSWTPNTPEARAEAKIWLASAIKNGFRHIDTAVTYFTEGVVGEVIKESGIPREQFYITTKLGPFQHRHVAQAFKQSLENLKTDYVDLYLIHWPQAILIDENNDLVRSADGTPKCDEGINFIEVWSELENIYRSGRAKAIGVSNFSIKTLTQLLDNANIVPAVNQVELHPYLAQNDLVSFCKSKGIVLTAYTPSGYATVRNDPLIIELAGKYKVSPNQITLAWHLARDTVIVAKSADSARQRENLHLPTLEAEDVAKIDKLDRNQRLCNAPNEKNMVWGWTMEQLGWN